jgi:hypothetical protein
MDIVILSASGGFALLVALTLFLKRKSIKSYFESVERKKEWARKRHSFVEKMNEAVNPFTGYNMITYTSNGKRNEKAIMSYHIPLEDLNCKIKWKSFMRDELNHFIESLKTHEFKLLEISDCNGSKRIVRLK